MGDRIHFGAIKLQDRDRMVANRPMASSNSMLTTGLSDAAQRNIAQREAVLHQMEQEKLARSIAVPTIDSHVKLRLRELGQPIILFGEGN